MLNTTSFYQTAHWRSFAAMILLALGLAATATAQNKYASPQAAADAFVDAVASGDQDGLTHVLGTRRGQLMPAGVAQDDVYAFLSAWAEQHEIISDGNNRSWLSVGRFGWTLPIPIQRTGSQWRFDPITGKAEIQQRTIAYNELLAMDTLIHLQAAQQRYQQGVGQGQYAARLVSRPGTHDGLYWPGIPGGPTQVLGPDALAMGPDVPVASAYDGYRFHLIPGQETYTLVAWPARYGQTGIHSFMLGPDGKAMKADLGPVTKIPSQRTLDAADWAE